MRVIKVGSISSAARQLSDYASSLDARADALALSLAGTASGTAKSTCPQSSGTLARSIRVDYHGGGRADVVAASEHAAFVEFGTGIGPASTRRQDASAMAESGYRVNASGKGEAGWLFPTADGWKLTHGQSGKGFMAAGAEEARDRLYRTARQVFGS